jgi:hypothetical protein
MTTITKLKSALAALERAEDTTYSDTLQALFIASITDLRSVIAEVEAEKSELEQFRAIRPKLLAELKEISAIFRELGKVKK